MGSAAVLSGLTYWSLQEYHKGRLCRTATFLSLGGWGGVGWRGVGLCVSVGAYWLGNTSGGRVAGWVGVVLGGWRWVGGGWVEVVRVCGWMLGAGRGTARPLFGI